MVQLRTPPRPIGFVLIARLHALPGQADQVVALSAVDKKVEAGEPGMLLHTFDQDLSDPRALSGPRYTRTAKR